MSCGIAAAAENRSAPAPPSVPLAQSFEHVAAQAQKAMEENRTAEAIRLYDQGTKLRPAWSEGWWYLGTLNFDANQFSRARTAFAHFVSVEHRQPGPGFGMLGLCDFQLKDYPRALVSLEHGLHAGLGANEPFVQRVLYVDGLLNNLFGNPEIALARLTLLANQIAAEHPEDSRETVLGNPSLLHAFGLAALRIARLPDDVPPEKASLIQAAGHAQALLALQDRAAAGTEFKNIVAQYPSEPGVHYMYGVYLLKEDPPSAVGEFRREIQNAPANAAAYIELAFQYLSSADYEQGLNYARQGVNLAPANFAAHVACGRLWLATGDTDHALRELRTAVRLSPGSPDAHFALSQALSRAGLNTQAAQERNQFQHLKTLANAADR